MRLPTTSHEYKYMQLSRVAVHVPDVIDRKKTDLFSRSLLPLMGFSLAISTSKMGSTTTRGWFVGSKSLGFMATCLLALLVSVQSSTINIKNQCSQTITACAASQSGPTNCYVLNAGSGNQLIDVGSSWTGGIVWGFPGGSGSTSDGINAKPQANLAEFTINGFSGQDSYDISLVNAYNLPMQIDAIGKTGSGLNCGTIQCSIPDIGSFCQPPNTLTGNPGNGCYNHDGPNANAPTPGTQPFKNACPETYTFSTDNTGTVYGCATGTNYEVVFCY